MAACGSSGWTQQFRAPAPWRTALTFRDYRTLLGPRRWCLELGDYVQAGHHVGVTGFADEMAARLPAPFVLPEPFRLLLDWAERNGYINDGAATLHEASHDVGTHFAFRIDPAADAAEHVRLWLGVDDQAAISRLVPFASTAADGTTAALWLDDDGRQRIVALGSGSGSTLACVLTDDPVDFLRLVAIGYQELAWPEEWTARPQADHSWTPVNSRYRDWLAATFAVSVPETASELVPRPAEMDDQYSDDAFARWLNQLHTA